MKPTTQQALAQLEELKKYGLPERLAADEWAEEWQTLIAILLSARTRDDVTIVVGEKLFAQFPTLESLANAEYEEVAAILMPVNFFQNKTKYVLSCARQLIDNFNGIVPHDVEQLITLTGVGRKTANVFLAQYGYPAIGVDTHVIQTANALSWSNAKNPDKIEQDLKKLFPEEKWNEVNDTCVHFGRTNQSPTKKKEIWEAVRNINPKG